MSERIGNTIPPPLRFELGAEQSAGDLCRCLLLVTADEDGWPRVAVLSYAEVAALDERRARVSVNAGTRTHHNLERGDSVLLWCVLDGAAYSLRGKCRRTAARDTRGAVEFTRPGSHADFELTIDEVLKDFYPASPMMSGPMYRRV